MVTVTGDAPMAVMGFVRTEGKPCEIRTRQAVAGAGFTRRRGRLAVTGLSALVIGALSVALATTAKATHSGAAAPGRYVTKVMVRPGQSLWSLAEACDPNADPRQAELEIQQLNSMTGDQLQAGQVLWVPRG
jgi:LysM repeat protein